MVVEVGASAMVVVMAVVFVAAEPDPSTLTTDVTSVGSLDTTPMTAPMLPVGLQDEGVGVVVVDHLDTPGNVEWLKSGMAF